MPLFLCSKCGCYENTALSNFWTRGRDASFAKISPVPPPLCSECDPAIGKWHGKFEKEPANAMLVDDQGFLYHDRLDAARLQARILGVVVDGIVLPLTARQKRMPKPAAAAKGAQS